MSTEQKLAALMLEAKTINNKIHNFILEKDNHHSSDVDLSQFYDGIKEDLHEAEQCLLEAFELTGSDSLSCLVTQIETIEPVNAVRHSFGVLAAEYDGEELTTQDQIEYLQDYIYMMKVVDKSLLDFYGELIN